MVPMLAYCCPLCKGRLEAAADAYCCDACGRLYPVFLGIPDFRVFPDPYIDYEADRQKALRLHEKSLNTDFRGLVDYYWSITPEDPRDLVNRYVQHALAGEIRGQALLDELPEEIAQLGQAAPRVVMELGCRSGGLLCAAARRYPQVIGIDIAFRWLIVARKRLEEAQLSAQLVCCCAEHLPFVGEQIDLILAENVLEHTARQQQLLDEAHRALRPGGVLLGLTCNRFSLAAEPHVGVWGVGWMPRAWMSGYVQMRRGIAYQHVRLVSFLELRQFLRLAGFFRTLIRPPELSTDVYTNLTGHQRRLLRMYNRIKSWPLAAGALLLVGPILKWVSVRGENGDSVASATRRRT